MIGRECQGRAGAIAAVDPGISAARKVSTLCRKGKARVLGVARMYRGALHMHEGWQLCPEMLAQPRTQLLLYGLQCL